MGITHTDRDGKSTTTYEGCVLRTFRRDLRVMSDVYSYASYADVWDMETMTVKTVLVDTHFENDSTRGVCVIDAEPGMFVLAARHEARAQIQQSIARGRKYALEAHHRVVVGRKMRSNTTRGKNKGKVGVVFWERDGRAGLALSDKKDASGRNVDVAWINSDRLENVDPFEYAGFDLDAWTVACDLAELRGKGADTDALRRAYRDVLGGELTH